MSAVARTEKHSDNYAGNILPKTPDTLGILFSQVDLAEAVDHSFKRTSLMAIVSCERPTETTWCVTVGPLRVSVPFCHARPFCGLASALVCTGTWGARQESLRSPSRGRSGLSGSGWRCRPR
jgi:hypothetical protein